jgi:hypothetical protein
LDSYAASFRNSLSATQLPTAPPSFYSPAPSAPVGSSQGTLSQRIIRLRKATLELKKGAPPTVSKEILDLTPPLVSELLVKIAQANDTLLKNQSEKSSSLARAANRFRGKSPPAISLAAYGVRMVKYAPCAPSVWLCALVLIDRLCGGGQSSAKKEAPGTPGTPGKSASPRIVVCSANVHRLLLATFVVATKYHSDVFYTNAHYARVGGVTLLEMNQLERDVLALCDFDLRVDSPELSRYASRLIALDRAGALGEPDPEDAPKRGKSTPAGHRPSEINTSLTSTRTLTPIRAPPSPDASPNSLNRLAAEQHAQAAMWWPKPANATVACAPPVAATSKKRLPRTPSRHYRTPPTPETPGGPKVVPLASNRYKSHSMF